MLYIPSESESFDRSLVSQLSWTRNREDFIQKFWGCNFESSETSTRNLNLLGGSYFRYMQEQCHLATYNDQRCRQLATFDGILDIIQQLRDEQIDRIILLGRLQKRFDIPDNNSGSSTSGDDGYDDLADTLIDLAARLWLMISVGGYRQISMPGIFLEWRKGTIQDALSRHFDKTAHIKESVNLGKIFNARNLEKIGGIRIIWTSNLADHLLMQDDDTRVSIFHHATFLHYHKTCGVFPKGFVEETLQTLALLLPCHDKKVKKWYQKQVVRFKLDENATIGSPMNTEDRQIENFEYWHDRLIILKEAFDDGEPSTILQWWQDRRRRVQWYTFWVAVLVLILTIVFGIIQSVEGAMQVYMAYHPR